MAASKARFKTIDAYIASYPKNVAKRLQTIRRIVKEVAPQATEAVSYNMPAFKLKGILIYFAAHQHHIGLYPYPSAVQAFKKEAAGYYTTGPGTIQFPHDKPLPVPLIRKIVKYRKAEKIKENKKSR